MADSIVSHWTDYWDSALSKMLSGEGISSLVPAGAHMTGWVPMTRNKS